MGGHVGTKLGMVTWMKTSSSARWLVLLFTMVSLLMGGPAHAGSSSGVPVFVTPPSKPTEVKLGVYIVALTRVDPPAEAYPTFEAEIFLDMVWKDPRLAFDPAEVGVEKQIFLEHEAELELERIWWPDIGFENAQGHRDIAAREVMILPDGTIEYSERSHGKFTFDPDLRKFPFDHQTFKLKLESFAWNEGSLVLVPYEAKMGFDESIHLQEWSISGISHEISSRKEVRSPTPFSALSVKLEVDRESDYYLWKIVAPLLIIVVFNWSTFWMPGEENSVRLERAFIALLTVVAFHQIVAANLPRISYMTFMDAVVLLAFASVGLTMISIMICQTYQHAGNLAAVRRLNTHARWAFPAVFALAMIVLWFAYH
jgi:hypothetical protein